jgi:BirA family transcriptional regulator, biotin operon repressor / biotin---[acetyl-CoA-carboxylase] ligase
MSALGWPRLHLRRIGSTNDRARELACAGAPHGTLVTASEQTAGRGRQGRRWTAPPDSALLLSLILRPAHNPEGLGGPTAHRAGQCSVSAIPDRSLPLLPLIAAVAVCDVAGEEARIKWPNDIVLPQVELPAGAPALGKLAGILAEGRPQAGWAVLGIGLNVAVKLEDLPAELRSSAATLGCPPAAVEPTLRRLLAALEQRLAESATATLDAWRSRDVLYGREISWGAPSPSVPPGRRPPGDRGCVTIGRGRAAGIDGRGRLVVALADGGRTTLEAGEVHLEPLG